MRELTRVYRGLLRAAVAEALEYRAQAIFWLVSAVFPLVMMAVWLAVVEEAGPLAGWGGPEFVSYYVAATLINRLTNSWSAWNWEADIQNGTLSVKLLRPVDPFHHTFAEQIGWKVLDLLLVAPVVVVAALLSPTISFPLDAARLAALALAVLMGFVLNELMSATFGMVAFWTTQSSTIYALFLGAGQFLSGWIAPLAVFPGPVQQLAALLPFRSLVGLPVEWMIGRLGWAELWAGLGVTLAWSLLFLALYRTLWRLGLRRYEAVGA